MNILHLSDLAPDSAGQRFTEVAAQAKSVGKITLSGVRG